MDYPDQGYPDQKPALAGLYEATKNLSTAQAAQVIRISKGYGIPTVDAAAALPTFGSYANDDVDWDGVRVRSPLTTDFLLGDPYYAKALQASIRDLEAAEGTVKTWKAFKNGVKGVGRGLLRFGQMVQETVQNADNTLAPINENEFWANPAKESIKAFENPPKDFQPATTLRQWAESPWLKPKMNTPNGLGEELWLGFVETIPQIAAQMLVAGATGGSGGIAAGTLFMGSQIAGSQYEKLTTGDNKVEPFRAFQASMADAIMQAPLEAISLTKLFKRVPVGKSMREYLEKATTEAVTEWMQQYPEGATEIWATRPGASVRQIAGEIVDDILNLGPITQEGLKQGIIAAPFGLLGGWAANSAAKIKERRAEADKAHLEQLQDAAGKISTTSPEAAAAYINHVTDGEVVYAQPDVLYQLAIEKPEILDELGVTVEEIEQAHEEGQLVEVPVGEYSVAMSHNPEVAQQLNDHVTTDVSEATVTEARERAAVNRNRRDVSDAIRRTNEDTTGLKSAQKELYDELVTAGMGAKEAKETVAIYTANSRIMAASRGANHAEWFRENRPVIRKGQEMPVARPRVNPDGSPVFFQEDYRGSHTAPTKKDGEQANPLHDITTVYPEDVYGPMAARYYGHGDRAIDDQSVRIIHQLRHNPNAKVTIYRAVPKGVNAEINVGDWVTINQQYARMHGEHALNGKYKIIKKSVYARDIYTDGNSIHEWGYDPQPAASKEEIAAMKSRQRMYQSQLAEEKLKQDEANFAQAVDNFWNNKLETTNPVPVMTTPLVLKLVGAEVLPVEIDLKILNKVLKDKHGETIERDTLKQVPRKIADPIMVLKNRDENGVIIPGETVVVLDLKDADKNTIIVPIILDAVSIGSGKVNKIKSVFGKGSKTGENIQWFATRIALGDLLYVNKKRTTDLLSTARHQSSMALNFSSSFDKSIPNENDLSKLKSENPQYYQTAKGSIHWENGRAVIQLFATADASTGIHELLGHYMTQNLLDMGAQEDAPEWMQKDRQTMLEWAGITDWDAATKEQKVEAHEKWARAAEVYIMEGKAPSLEMRGVFRRFAEWLRQVYRSVKELGVEISPEMRSVFDRMLASEEEILQAAEINDFMSENSDLYEGLSAKAKDKLNGQLDKILEQGKEILLKEMIGDINSERKAEMGREREKIEAEVREELSNQPFYRMVRELRKPSVRNPFNELTKQWQNKIDEMAKYLRANHGDGVENVKVFDAGIEDEQAKTEAFYRVSHNVKWYQDWYKDHDKAPTMADYKMLAEEFLRNGFDDLTGHIDPDVDFLELERQIEELQQTPQAMPIVRKLNTQWLKEYYPDKLNLFAFMHSNTGQYTLDDMAAWYAFSSADEIVWRMENTPSLSKAIHDAVEARMNAAFPEMTREEVRQAAEASMYNDESASLLAIQLGLIREKAGQIMAAEESRKQAAQDRELAGASAQKAIDRMSMDRAMNLPTWIAAERRAAEKVEKAIADEDWATAFEQKTIQLHNHAMVQESLKARREFDRINRFLKRQQQSGSETWITDEQGPDGTVSKSDRHFAAASEILKRFGYLRKDAVAMTETLAQYVHRMEEENPEMVSIADWIANDTNSALLRELTIGKLRDIEAALRNIKKMARTGRNADGFHVLNGDGLIMTVNNLADTAEANVKDKQIDLPDKVNPGALAELFAGLRKPSKWLLELDGFKEFGAWSKAFYHALADATNIRSFLENRAKQRLESAYDKAGIDKAQRYRDAHEKIYIPELETSVSKNWLMAALLNMGSESNLQRLFSRHPVGININVAWNKDTLTTVLTRELGANYFHLAQDIWNAIDMYDEYTAMVKKVTGAELKKVVPSPISFSLPSGETVHLQGGYYHLKADRRSSMQAELNAEKELGDTPGIMPYPQTGASKARAFGAAYSVDLDLSNIYQSIHNQAHDIAFRPVAIDLNKLMRSETVKEVFRRKMGDASYSAFSKWLRVIETGRDTTVESRGFMDSGANFLRQRAVVANLLYRVGTVFQNFANPALYGNAVEGFSQKDAFMAYMKYGWGDYIPKALSFSPEAEAIRQEVFALSAMMKDKAENPDYTMRDMFSRDGGFLMDSSNVAAREAGVKLKITRENVLRFGSNMLAYGDQLADIPMWRYAYHKSLNEGRSQAEAVRFADMVIENSSGTGRAIDSSLLQMGSPLEKTLTMFMTFLNTQYNRWATEAGIYMKERDHLRLLSFIGTQYILFGVLSAGFSFKWKKDDDDWSEWFAKEVLEWPLSMIPVGGGLAKYAFDSAMGFKTFSWSASPVERSVEQLAKLVSAYGKGKATTEDTMTSLAFVFGYPDQFNDWFWNAYDAANGMNPRIEDLIRRRPRRER